MAAAATAVLPTTSSTQLYQQAVALLRQRRFEHALITAKKALDGANGASMAPQTAAAANISSVAGSNDAQQLLLCAKCWHAMALAAAGMGDTEVAYCLYAKGYQHCQDSMPAAAVAVSRLPRGAGSPSSSEHVVELNSVVQQLAAGKLQTLAALCQSPTEMQQQQQLQQRSPVATCKRWQRTQHRFQLGSSSSSNGSSLSVPSSSSRIFCVSDLHVDQGGGVNMTWVNSISSSAFKSDVIIVAGDIGDTAAAVSATFRALCTRFKRVVWVPGNHELWIRPGSRDAAMYPDSFAKLLALRQMADECGVDVGPIEVQPGLIVLPLLSWYNTQYDVRDPQLGRYMHDSFCSWPVSAEDVWHIMMRLNTASLELVREHIVQLQQLPQQQLLLQPSQRQQPRLKQQQVQQPQQPTAVAAAVPLVIGGTVTQPGPSTCNATMSDGVVSNSSSSSKSRVHWNTQGFLAVKSVRQVPGLQLNLQPTVRGQTIRQQQRQQPAQPATAAAAALTPSLSQSPVDTTAAAAAAEVAALHAAPVTVITVSHFLPHPNLPHSRFCELTKAMGCCELQWQLEQVSSQVHVYGHSHINADVVLPTASALQACASSSNSSGSSGSSNDRSNGSSGSSNDRSNGSSGSSNDRSNGSSSSSSKSDGSRRYVQYALDAVGPASDGLYCLWDGSKLTVPGCIIPVTGH